MFIKILIALAILIVVFVIIVAVQPSAFRVARSATIAAPPAAVFAQVNDLHAWEAWSPWAKIDPAMTLTYEGPPAGTGAAYAWSGNSKVGQGRATITESRPNELVRLRLDFLRPFKGTNVADFAFEPRGDQTQVTWSMSGNKNFITKAIGLFCSMDTMIGGEFEKGLAQMKSIAEAGARR